MIPEQGQEEPSQYDEITDKVTYRGHCIISVNQGRYTYSVLYCRVVRVLVLCVDPLRLIFDSMRNRASFDRVCVCLNVCVIQSALTLLSLLTLSPTRSLSFFSYSDKSSLESTAPW